MIYSISKYSLVCLAILVSGSIMLYNANLIDLSTGKEIIAYTSKIKDFVISDNEAESPPIPVYPNGINRRNNLSNCNIGNPVTAIDPWEWLRFPKDKWKNLTLPLLTSGNLGRLGNVMGEYATLLALGRAYNITVRMSNGMKKDLIQLFPHLTIDMMPKGGERVWKRLPYRGTANYGHLQAAAAGLLGPYVYVIDGYPMEIQLFHAYTCDIRKEFTFAPRIQEKVSDYFKSLRNRTKDVVLVGFHIRRTDYKKYFRGRTELPGNVYYENAMAYYKNRFSRVLFIVASDDLPYVKDNLQSHDDVVYTPGTDRGVDMGILASCDHSIITVGTFGFWTGYLAGGLVVYPKNINVKKYPIQGDNFKRSHLDFFVPVGDK